MSPVEKKREGTRCLVVSPLFHHHTPATTGCSACIFPALTFPSTWTFKQSGSVAMEEPPELLPCALPQAFYGPSAFYTFALPAMSFEPSLTIQPSGWRSALFRQCRQEAVWAGSSFPS